MSQHQTAVAPIGFVNVQVVAKYDPVTGNYTPKCLTDPILITEPSVINFQLIDPPEGVKFNGKRFDKHPTDKHQLSGPTVSTDGTMLTLNNVYTLEVNLNVTLYLTAPDGADIPLDPQIRNEPPGTDHR